MEKNGTFSLFETSADDNVMFVYIMTFHCTKYLDHAVEPGETWTGNNTAPISAGSGTARTTVASTQGYIGQDTEA